MKYDDSEGAPVDDETESDLVKLNRNLETQ